MMANNNGKKPERADGGGGAEKKAPATTTFGQPVDDTFRNYMSRKIDLQRQQFGLVLPPPPSTRPLSKQHGEESSSKKGTIVTHNNPMENHDLHVNDSQTANTSIPTQSRSSKVKFDLPPLESNEGESHEFSGILNRLKQRHGKVSRPKRKRDRIRRSQRHDDIVTDSEESIVQKKRFLQDNATSDDLVDGTRVFENELPVVQLPSPLFLKRARPDLFFHGIVVLVNGYTDPDAATIMRLMHQHGGDLEKYETRRVTHIIAEHLSTAKANIYKRQRRPTPVCHPHWVTESVQAGRLLPHADYLIDEVLEAKNATKSVKTFFNVVEKRMPPPLPPTPTNRMESPPRLNMSTNRSLSYDVVTNSPSRYNEKKTQSGDINLCDAIGSSACEKPQSAEDNKRNEALDPKPTMNYIEEIIDSDADKKGKRKNDEVLATEKPKAISPGSKPTSFTSSIRTVGTDANFLDSFFINSRLSFIGSYKQRMSGPGVKGIESSNNEFDRNHFERLVFHVDMDCFFAAVALRNYPQYRKMPVAIAHAGKGIQALPPQMDQLESKSPSRSGLKKSTSECATCNYEARKFGIKKGMFLGRARELCPNLIILNYDFEGYEEVSDEVIGILHHNAESYHGKVEQVSCDEAYVELFLPNEHNSKDSVHNLAYELCEKIRSEIFAATQCTASIGVGQNKFLAKLATDKVKPNGCYVVKEHTSFLKNLQLRSLPGIGHRIEQKCLSHQLNSVKDVWDLGDDAVKELSSILGAKTAEKIVQFCSGRDDRPVQMAERKTIGAECNYGVRFDGPYGVDHMVTGLAKEVQKRMETVSVYGKRVTLKVMKRKEGARPPPKFLGHGSCYHLSKSCDIVGSAPTQDSTSIATSCMRLLEEMAVDTDDVRGMGIVVSKLAPSKEGCQSGGIATFFKHSSNDAATQGQSSAYQNSQKETTTTLFARAINSGSLSALNSPVGNKISTSAKDLCTIDATASSPISSSSPSAFIIPNLSQIDHNTLGELPADYQDEINRQLQQRGKASNEQNNKNHYDDTFESHSTQKAGSELMTRSIPTNEYGTDQAENSMDSICSESVAHEELDLPPLDQLDMSQVMSLPEDMRNMILEKIHGQKNNVKEKLTLSPTHDTSASILSPSRTFNYSIKKREHKGEKTNVDSAKDSGRFRQVSVRRMLKLASVKSDKEALLGKFGEGTVSLTQLECLPFEMQLQIANDDEIGLSSSIFPSRVHQKSSRKITKDITNKVHSPTRNKPPVSPSGTLCSDQGHDDASIPKGTTMDSLNDAVGNFYKDNARPLCAWLNGITEPGIGDVERVQEFFNTCIKEGRTDDVIKMLRVIKNRHDIWSAWPFDAMITAVDTALNLAEGYRLDLEWLGLK